MSTRPNFAAIAQAVELGAEHRAVEFIATQLRADDASIPELQRKHLWLGYAYRKHDNVVQALFHFEAASSVDWSLAGYARFGAAQSLMALGRPEEALRRLAELKANEPLATAAELLRAKILAQTSRALLAIPIWRAYLAHAPSSEPERGQISLMLAEALLALSSPQQRPVSTSFLETEPTASAHAYQQEAFELLDPLRNKGLDAEAQERAVQLRELLIKGVFAGQPSQQQQCRLSDRINELEVLVEQHEVSKAMTAAESLFGQLQSEQRYSEASCRTLFCLAQLRMWKGQSSEAAAAFESVASNCGAPDDLVARALFQSGRRLQDLHDAPAAIARFEDLQKRFPQHRLADDARLKAANAYLELGSESKFVDLILRMPDDFPLGDQVPEGLFMVALHRMVKRDWSGASTVLATMGQLPRIVNHEDAEQTERYQYFLARAQWELGQTEQAMTQWERLVRERPFSFYMLLAQDRLMKLAPERAQSARSAGISDTGRSPFEVPYQAELDVPGFVRAMELMALGQPDDASAELRALNLTKDIEPQLLWARASFDAAAGDIKASQRIIRDRFRGWPRFWPAGTWEGAWKLAFPRPYLEIVQRETRRSGVAVPLVYAVMREESLFDQQAVSAADAHGLMQLIVPTAQTAAKELGITVNARALKRPEINIAVGCQVLKGLLKKFPSQPLLAIAGYNAGPGRPMRWVKERPDMDLDVWVETIPFAETRTYVKHVLASWAAYVWLYDRSGADSLPPLSQRIND
jgi:soluble lytic murein transglycosylase